MRFEQILVIAAASLALSGCIARTAANIVTAPVSAASKAVDLATTSQSEADEKRGRELRQREERLGQLERQYFDQRQKCERGRRSACEDMNETYAEIEALRPSIPVEPRR